MGNWWWEMVVVEGVDSYLEERSIKDLSSIRRQNGREASRGRGEGGRVRRRRGGGGGGDEVGGRSERGAQLWASPTIGGNKEAGPAHKVKSGAWCLAAVH